MLVDSDRPTPTLRLDGRGIYADTAHVTASKLICSEVPGENMWLGNEGHGCSKQ